jgi:hypothetical protein
MKKRKARKKSSTRKAPRTAVPSKHPVHINCDDFRDKIHTAMASAGITGLSLRSLQFASTGDCPPGQHLEKVCSTDPSGTETCTWKCVPN